MHDTVRPGLGGARGGPQDAALGDLPPVGGQILGRPELGRQSGVQDVPDLVVPGGESAHPSPPSCDMASWNSGVFRSVAGPMNGCGAMREVPSSTKGA